MLPALLIVTTALMSCGQLKAIFQNTDHFVQFDASKAIYYETGAKDIARKVAENLGPAIRQIERDHFRPFAAPVKIYICANEESFAAHTGLNRRIKAAVFNKKIFINAVLRKQPGRIPRLTTHELSHLHIIQHIGTGQYVRNIPSWFSEGLAVLESGGGGAELVSEAEAARAIVSGNCFHPEAKGSLLFPKTASSYGLKPHMFYRQSAMFVDFIRKKNSEGFKNFLTALQDQTGFEQAMTESYNDGVESLWKLFIENLKLRTDLEGH